MKKKKRFISKEQINEIQIRLIPVFYLGYNFVQKCLKLDECSFDTNVTKCPDKSKLKVPVYIIDWLASVLVSFLLVGLRVTVLASLRSRMRRTLCDLYSRYFSPQMMRRRNTS